MIEVGRDGLGAWVWTMVGASGRILIARGDYCSEACAIGAARRYRVAAFAAAAGVDHRQGACI